MPTAGPCAPATSPTPSPERDDQKANRVRKGARGSRPPTFDRGRYKQRNQVERLMNRRKQFRAVATRYDKLACRYAATVCVADIFIWLRTRPDQPRGDPRNTPSQGWVGDTWNRLRRCGVPASEEEVACVPDA